MSYLKLKKVVWADVRREFNKVNPYLARVIDAIDPGKNLPFLKVTYPFGASILEEGKCTLLDELKDDPAMLSLFNYSPIPLGLFLNKACETFLEIQGRIIPVFMLYPGNTIGLFETLDTLCDVENSPLWNVTAGARSIFMLAKVNNNLWHKRLLRHFNMNTATPKVLMDQWTVFKALANSEKADTHWHCDMLYFTKNWIDQLKKNQTSAWVQLREFLYKECWRISRSVVDRSFSFIWQHFALSTMTRNYKPRIYIIDTIRHLISVGCGLTPAFIPAVDEISAPIRLIKKAYHEIYDLPHLPTLITPAYLQEESAAVYYSLGYPTLVEGNPETDNGTNTISDLKEIKMLLENMQGFCEKRLSTSNKLVELIQKMQFDYYHKAVDAQAEVKAAEFVTESDPHFLEADADYSNKGFCSSSPFLNGCIQIRRWKSEHERSRHT